MELQEFTTFLREKTRSFDKFTREEPDIPIMDLKDWIKEFIEWIS